MKIKKVKELNLSDYKSEEELNQYRNINFHPEKNYTLFGEMLEKDIKPKYVRLFDGDNDLESCINWYEEYLEETADMKFGASVLFHKLTGSRRITKYHNVILLESSTKLLDIDTLLTTRKFNV